MARVDVIWGGLGACAMAAYATWVTARVRPARYRHEAEADVPAPRGRALVDGAATMAAGLLGLQAPARGAALLLPLGVLAVCVPLALVDLDVQRLPDRWLLPALPAAAAVAFAAAAMTGRWDALLRVGWLVPVVTLIFLGLYAAGRGTGLGFGDVKLAALLAMPAAWDGAFTAAMGFVTAFLLAGGFAGVLLATGRARRETSIPFGPFLMLGTFAWLLGG